jgi:proteasome alpha subunit
MQFYASPEQIMRDRAEYARKNIARGRNAIVITCVDGVLFVAENLSSTLHKVSEIYDRIGFAAVGRYNEFENLRRAGVRMADVNGYMNSRRDVTGRALANAYAQTLGALFTDQFKAYEVEICVAEVGATPDADELYRNTYDGSVGDERGLVVMGGQAEQIAGRLREEYREDQSLQDAVRLAVKGLGSVGGENGAARTLPANQLEVAILDRNRPGRTFRRITGAALTALLEPPAAPDQTPVPPAADTAVAEPAATPAKPRGVAKPRAPRTAPGETGGGEPAGGGEAAGGAGPGSAGPGGGDDDSAPGA